MLGEDCIPESNPDATKWDRRDFMKLAAAIAGAVAATRAGASGAQEAFENAEITSETLEAAERVAGLSFTDEERKLLLGQVKSRVAQFEEIRALEIPNTIPPAMHFNPAPAGFVPAPALEWQEGIENGTAAAMWDGEKPDDAGDLALLSAYQLSALLQRGEVSPVELTEIYIERLKTLGAKLNCVVTMMDESAKQEAAKAESDIKAGRIRGPLHGIPWGAKDLLSTRGVRTTWGAKPYENQVIDEDATVVERLREAGAILVAKLSLGELAQGDRWMYGRTLNPWNLERGSSGSSAGPGAATAAGLVGFSIGTETLGSIVSPSTVCGVTGHRPTFGRVSRHGAMALSWSMDKIGPMCRSVEDCALVFGAIQGADERDPTAVDAPFRWPAAADFSKLRFGYDQEAFDAIDNSSEKTVNDAALAKLRELGADLRPIQLPEFPLGAIRMVLSVEAAAAFDDLTRSNRDDLLSLQSGFGWPNTFRSNRYVPAVEYIQAQRARTMLMREMAKTMESFDVFVAPSRGGRSLTLTNLTGHPTVVLPHGFVDGMPRAICFIGHLYDDARLLAIAKRYQESTAWHRKHPVLGIG